jgi:hypothetical protein
MIWQYHYITCCYTDLFVSVGMPVFSFIPAHGTTYSEKTADCG